MTAGLVSSAFADRLLPFEGSHCAEAEYAEFLERLAIDPNFRGRRLRYRREFIKRWPDFRDWFAAPLPERVGSLRGDKQAAPTYPVSFEARTYLFYLALTDRLRIDYDFLLALRNLHLVETMESLGIDFNIGELVEIGEHLEYSRRSLQFNVMWVVPRIALRTGIRKLAQLTQEHIDDFARSVDSYGQRKDLHLYHRPTDNFSYDYMRGWKRKLRGVQCLLYHRGNSVKMPRLSPCRQKPMPSARPDLQEWADRWIAIKRQTLAKATVDHMACSLRSFIDYLARAVPDLRNFDDVTLDLMNGYLESMKYEKAPKTGNCLSITARRARAGAVARFLAHGAAWEWPGFPSRLVLDVRNLPRLPRRVPRFIPEDELSRLIDAIRTLRCPFQKAALFTARWSGARRGEITRLPLDCLDRYPDGTARLRIPAGKTMKERMVPLHDEAADALRAVIALRKRGPERPVVDERTGDRVRFLFYRRGVRISPDYLFQYSLNIACDQAGLVDGSGHPTITAHRFRHTVGTQLAERGAKLHTIMSVLGHQSPHMSMVYARISDAEVLRDYQTVLGPGATIAGPGAEAIRAGDLSGTTVDWLKSNFLKTELELGHCLRLPSEGPCECDLYLSCAKFVTTPAYAPRLRERHRLEKTLAEDARQKQWTREEDRHCAIARRIEKLLIDLNEPLGISPEEYENRPPGGSTGTPQPPAPPAR